MVAVCSFIIHTFLIWWFILLWTEKPPLSNSGPPPQYIYFWNFQHILNTKSLSLVHRFSNLLLAHVSSNSTSESHPCIHLVNILLNAFEPPASAPMRDVEFFWMFQWRTACIGKQFLNCFWHNLSPRLQERVPHWLFPAKPTCAQHWFMSPARTCAGKLKTVSDHSVQSPWQHGGTVRVFVVCFGSGGALLESHLPELLQLLKNATIPNIWKTKWSHSEV